MLDSENEQLRQKIDRLQGQLSQNNHYKDQVKEVTDLLNQSKEEVERIARQKEWAYNRVTHLEASIKRPTSVMPQVDIMRLEDEIRFLEHIRGEQKSELEKERSSLEQLKSEHEAQLQTLREERDRAADRAREKAATITEMQLKLGKRKATLIDLTDAMERTTATLEETSKHLQTREHQLADTHEELEKVKKELSDARRLQRSVENSARDVRVNAEIEANKWQKSSVLAEERFAHKDQDLQRTLGELRALKVRPY